MGSPSGNCLHGSARTLDFLVRTTNIKRYAFVLGLNSNGPVVRNLQDPSPQCFAQIANVVEHKGTLYFGSIGESAIGRMAVPGSK